MFFYVTGAAFDWPDRPFFGMASNCRGDSGEAPRGRRAAWNRRSTTNSTPVERTTPWPRTARTTDRVHGLPVHLRRWAPVCRNARCQSVPDHLRRIDRAHLVGEADETKGSSSSKWMARDCARSNSGQCRHERRSNEPSRSMTPTKRRRICGWRRRFDRRKPMPSCSFVAARSPPTVTAAALRALATYSASAAVVARPCSMTPFTAGAAVLE